MAAIYDYDKDKNKDISMSNNISMSSENFAKLSKETQGDILYTIREQEAKSGGWIGKIFGTDEKKASIYAAIGTCLILIIAWISFTIVGVYTERPIELKFIEGLLMLVGGFLFGKSRN